MNRERLLHKYAHVGCPAARYEDNCAHPDDCADNGRCLDLGPDPFALKSDLGTLKCPSEQYGRDKTPAPYSGLTGSISLNERTGED